ncbi:hypothetical protein [Pedobacter arcticus]|uniref:hypothetical protein n=1 Tax=Pedobacter arcticus TaxID=752140 RepID=UPI0012B5CD28|nr:hypothetical protein [Pedobacter arcticus]
MKKLILIGILFFNLIPVLKKGTIGLAGPQTALADSYGEGWDNYDGLYGSLSDLYDLDIVGSHYNSNGEFVFDLSGGDLYYPNSSTLDEVIVTAIIEPFPDYQPPEPITDENANEIFDDFLDWINDNPPPETTPDPCNQANSLGKNESFKDKMDDLKGKTGLDYEVGYLFKNGGSSSADYTSLGGVAGQTQISIPISSIAGTIDGYIHTHYGSGTIPVFSIGDILSIYTLNNAGKITDLSTFTIGVVTDYGTQYILKIDDIANFNSFYDVHFTTNANMDALTTTYLDNVANYMNASAMDFKAASELAFLKMLEGSGMKTFKGNSNFDKWNPIKNVNDEVKPNKCN